MLLQTEGNDNNDDLGLGYQYFTVLRSETDPDASTAVVASEEAQGEATRCGYAGTILHLQRCLCVHVPWRATSASILGSALHPSVGRHAAGLDNMQRFLPAPLPTFGIRVSAYARIKHALAVHDDTDMLRS